MFRQREFYKKHECAIREMAQGTHLWSTNASDNINKFRKYVEEEWLIIPSNTQLIERWVKDSNECTFTNKEEHLASLMAICRSDTLFGYLFDETQIDMELRANQFVTKGKKGERIDKRTGSVETTKMERRASRNAPFESRTITNTIMRHGLLESLDIHDADRNHLKSLITTKSEQYMTVRDSLSVKNYTATINQHQNTEPNVIQRRSGFDVTYHMRKEVKYTVLCTRHIPLVHREFVARFGNDDLDRKMKIRDLTREFKKRIISAQKQEVCQRTGCTIDQIPEGVVNEVTYIPIVMTIDEYGLD